MDVSGHWASRELDTLCGVAEHYDSYSPKMHGFWQLATAFVNMTV